MAGRIDAVKAACRHCPERLSHCDKDGNSLLHLAAYINHSTEIATLLIESQADPNARNQVGDTPLHCAVQYNRHADLTRLLLSANADPSTPSLAGWTPLHLAAVDDSSVEAALALLASKANPNVQNKAETHSLIRELIGII
eukprot:TRINITY_DN11128_c0_g1_i2.p1 TRINITY_DN11128_c0_g1~~TRINITY_DN11128_c0_g1_i2.p1  ORF type:complete len:141 (+),score=19.01 TRINITY_DN11128_c0_g1_i2:150-572(+)